MLWVALCLLLLQTVAAQNQVCEIYTEAKEDGFKALAVVGLYQNLPDSNLAELVPLIGEASTLGAMCCSDAPTADCERDPSDLFQSAVCASASLAERNDLKACCEKSGTERTECFLDHKAKIPQDLSIQPEPPAPEQCEEFKKDNTSFVGRFIFSFSKRHVMLQPQMVLEIAKRYGDVLASCCGEVEPQTCFDTKKAQFHAAVRSQVARQRSLCLIRQQYGDRLVQAKMLIDFSQKVPQASFEEVKSIVEQIMSTVGPCCQGNMVQCMRERKQNMDTLCANEALVSRTTGLAACCKVAVLRRGSCLAVMKPDPKPDKLSVHHGVHDDITATCGTFTTSRDEAMAKLLYEVSRRHPEASEESVLQYANAAEQAYVQCCSLENHADCVGTAMQGHNVEYTITDSTAYYKSTCNMEKTIGHEEFEKMIMTQYTAVMPQASFDVLHAASERIAEITNECCKEDLILPCSENQLSDTADVMCHGYDAASINPQITDCCNRSYLARRLCILSMRTVTNFRSPDLNATTLMGADLCTKTGRDLLLAEKRLLYTLVRQKTTIKMEQLRTISNNYQIMKTKCCAEADQAACFRTDGPNLITRSAELLKV